MNTLTTDSYERKKVPLASGLLSYFPAALAGVARTSYTGNLKHNGDVPLFHARGKSSDHPDCILRHLMDLQDILARIKRCESPSPGDLYKVTEEVSCLAWRALALSQELHEKYAGAPIAPGAK